MNKNAVAEAAIVAAGGITHTAIVAVGFAIDSAKKGFALGAAFGAAVGAYESIRYMQKHGLKLAGREVIINKRGVLVIPETHNTAAQLAA